MDSSENPTHGNVNEFPYCIQGSDDSIRSHDRQYFGFGMCLTCAVGQSPIMCIYNSCVFYNHVYSFNYA